MQGPLQKFPMTDVCTDETMALALDGLAQSAAMLKNDKKTLPLTKGASVAVIGPQANMSSSTFSYYGPSKPCDGKFWSLTDAVAKYGGEVKTTLGVPSDGSEDVSGIPAAVEMAASADTVVLALGVDLSWAHEGHDSTTLQIPAAQMALVAQTTAAAKSPVTVVFFCANPLDISALLSNPKIGAIIHVSSCLVIWSSARLRTCARACAHLPTSILKSDLLRVSRRASQVGQPSVTIYGLAEVLFGMRSPAGRTIQTIYEASCKSTCNFRCASRCILHASLFQQAHGTFAGGVFQTPTRSPSSILTCAR